MSAGSGPLTAQRPTDPAQTAQTAASTSSTVQKRPFAEESQHVGPNGRSQTHQGTGNAGNAPDSAAPSKPRSRPIFKMKRTGHSGPFPLSGRPVFPPSAKGKQNTPSPSTSSAPTPASLFFSGPFLNDLSRPPTGPQEQTINKPMPDLSLDVRESNSPRQSPAQTPMSLIIGGHHNMNPSRSSSAFEAPNSTDMPQPGIGTMPGSTPLLKPIIPLDVQAAFDSALDDKPYKIWTDEAGEHVSTAGALLPAGYQQSDDPFFPWLCPVRSCRKLLPTLPGLGKHFCNSHRATRFNDNLDGTLTDLGTYSDPTAGNGRRSNGFAKPALIVSKQAMTLDESPIAEMTLHAAKATDPQRGGPRRRPALNKAAAKSHDNNTDTDDEPATRATRASGKPQPASSTTAESRQLDMANPDRPYNMWPDKNGTLVPLTNGLLIPDGYKYDTTVADRPWICPVRTCRRLSKGFVDLGNHFRSHHRGTRLNDNLDGTFSVIAKTQNNTPAIVVSRDPMDFEDIAEPMRPIYPYGMAGKSVTWVRAAEDDPSFIQPRVEAAPDTDAMDVDVDAGLEFATEGRPYREWWDDSGKLVSMAGALIPEGYGLDDTFPGRPWICPVRSCRIVCKVPRGLGYHFTTVHKSSDFNDNGDGTLSDVGFHSRNAPRVVSKKRLDVNREPLLAPRLPPTSREGRKEAKKEKGATAPSRDWSPSSIASFVSHAIHTSDDSADKLWEHICSLVDLPPIARDTPEVTTLLSVPKMRDLDIVPSTLPADLNQKQIAGVIIQTVGEESPQPCSACRRHDGPFSSCVSLSAEAAQEVYSFMVSCSRACANCIVRKNATGCSVRKQHGPWVQASKQRLRDSLASADTPMLNHVVDDGGSAEDLPTTRRRSVQLFLASGDEGVDEEDEESADEAPPEPEQRPSRLVTLKMAQTRERPVSAWNRNPPREQDLHMENWEMGSGRVNKVGEVLAFSSTYLAANQTVQVAPNFHFQAITIPSGRAHQFQADATKTRMCTLGSGKLKVQVGGDEFVIGAQGIFNIVPGMACTVTNRCYVDLVLHVTSRMRDS